MYTGWCLVSYMGENNSNFLWGGWHWLNNTMGNALAFCTSALLKTSGYELIHYKRVITIEGTQGIYVGDRCLGLAPMVVFSGLALVYGNNRREQLLFIPMGLAVIFLVNVLRVTVFSLAQYYHNRHLEPANEFFYVTVTYGFILFMAWWMTKRSDRNSTQGVQ